MNRLRPLRADRPARPRRAIALFLGVGLATTLAAGGGLAGEIGSAECVPNEADGTCLPIAAEGQRVDIAPPTFSDPTAVTNPLFPIGALDSVVMLGEVDGKPFRTEVTLLPGTKTIDWNGQPVETLVSQYMAFSDGRILEVALDWYAQADDGAVWYFGEDVFNYEDGVVADTHGAWIAGEDGPAGLIMPGDPQVGDVYRPENIPGLVFEEVTVTETDVTVAGPHGPVAGAIVVSELHQDGNTEEKTFAPGYGEFVTGGGGDLEAVALAVPTDALSAPPAAELEMLEAGSGEVFDAVRADGWEQAAATVAELTAAWEDLRTGDVSPMIAAAMTDDLGALAAAVAARDGVAASHAALDVAQSSLDLQLRHRPATEIDLARFDLQARRLLVDAAAGDAAAVAGDVATLEWIRDRLETTVDPAMAAEIDAELGALRTAADAGDLTAATEAATRLRALLAEDQNAS